MSFFPTDLARVDHAATPVALAAFIILNIEAEGVGGAPQSKQWAEHEAASVSFAHTGLRKSS